MMDEDVSARNITLGDGAAHLLENEAFKTALSTLRDLYVKDWMSASTTDDREMCHHKMASLSKLIIELQSIMTTGQITRERIGALEGARNIWRSMSG